VHGFEVRTGHSDPEHVTWVPQSVRIDHGAHDSNGVVLPQRRRVRRRLWVCRQSRGYTNREIADKLVISVKTASVHVSHILRKLDIPNRREAAVAHRLAPP